MQPIPIFPNPLYEEICCALPSCHLEQTGLVFFLSHMCFLISKWAGYKLPGVKQFFCGFRGLRERYGFTAVKPQDQLQDPSWTQVTFVWTCYFVITSYFWSQGFLRKAGNQSFPDLALSHILSKIATLHCKIFHISSLSVSTLQSKTVGRMTSNWYAAYFQAIELSISRLNFLGLHHT